MSLLPVGRQSRMIMALTARSCELGAIQAWWDDYRREMSGQIVHGAVRAPVGPRRSASAADRQDLQETRVSPPPE
jgi:hypothetical protein